MAAIAIPCQPQQSMHQLSEGHGRLEKSTVSITHLLDWLLAFPGRQTLIRVESERQVHRANLMALSTDTRYSVASFSETVRALADHIRGNWGVENKVHHVREVTQGEDASRIRTSPLVQRWALARNFALNLHRNTGLLNMAQAQRLADIWLE